MRIDPILLEIFKNKFSSIAEEMGVTLNRTAFSPNIKERRDFSCAVFDREGNLVAHAAHIPVHLGSMPASVHSAIASVDFGEGDMVVLNDPFRGGTHLPDITLVAPVFIGEGEPAFYVANRAHHADVGGMSHGSMPLSTSIFQEGIIIPPLKLVSAGRVDRRLMSFLLSNVRTPVEREGDFAAQIMANTTGIRRMEELVASYGREQVGRYAAGLIDYAERITRKTIGAIADGTYEFADVMDDDGCGNENIGIRVSIVVKGEEATLDFSGSGAQVAGSVNAVYAIALSAIFYVFRCLIDEDIPTNAGCMRPLRIIAPEGTIVNARFPAAVAGGNVETSQRIVDVLLGALSGALPAVVPAASQGTMNNIAIGGVDPRTGRAFTYYETIGGGMGATAGGDGESAVHSHMTNTLNTPIEALEYAYPFLVKEYSIRRGTGGKGRHRGGDGLVREIQLLAEVEATVLSERRRIGPYGLAGGEAGTPGRNTVRKAGVLHERPGKFNELLKKGESLRIETPGGGGFGKP